MLNEYFPAVIEPIERYGGVVHQFQGDAMLVTFNVPVTDENHADNALRTALGIQKAIAGRKFLVGLISEPDGASMTASMGIASYPLHARTPEDMVVRADRAMQRIKTGTKNSIAIAEIQGDEDDG